MDPQSANNLFARICIQILLQDEIWDTMETVISEFQSRSEYVEKLETFLGARPFLRYAVESWALHIRTAGEPCGTLLDNTRKLASSTKHREGVMVLTFFLLKNWSVYVPAGNQPIHFAAYFNQSRLLKRYLTDDQIPVNIVNTKNNTPLLWASEMGSTECAKILLDAGTDPNICEEDGWSSLHWASRNGHAEIAKLLVDHGARLNQRDSGSHTPLEWAVDRQHWAVVDILHQKSSQSERAMLEHLQKDSNGRRPSADDSVRKKAWKLWDFRPDGYS